MISKKVPEKNGMPRRIRFYVCGLACESVGKSELKGAYTCLFRQLQIDLPSDI